MPRQRSYARDVARSRRGSLQDGEASPYPSPGAHAPRGAADWHRLELIVIDRAVVSGRRPLQPQVGDGRHGEQRPAGPPSGLAWLASERKTGKNQGVDSSNSGNPTEVAGSRLTPKEVELVQGLRNGDESAFAELIATYTPSLTRVAATYLKDRESANDVVQETWLGVLGSIGRFEGRSSLKTWLFRILVKRALTRAKKDSRSSAFSSLAKVEAGASEPAVDPDNFVPAGQEGAGGWASIAPDRSGFPEDQLVANETMSILRAAIDKLPEAQRMVITLRDLDHWTSSEVCNAMEISETNQRVLLHRARSKVRKALSSYLSGQES